MRISETGLNFIKRFEGLYLKAYLCSSGVPTIAWGTTIYPDGRKVQLGDTCTKEDAQEFLEYDMENKYEKYVESSVVFPLIKKQCEFDALVSFVYNVGKGGLHSPNSIDRRLRNGEDFHTVIKEELPRWNKAGGKISNGLVRRRKEELELFLSEETSTPTPPNDPKLFYREKSDDVKDFQHMLNVWLKKWGKTELIVDGVFGQKTLAAVKDFQINNKLRKQYFVNKLMWDRVVAFYKKETSDESEQDIEPVGFHTWSRGRGEQLAENFHGSEFECKCGRCVEQKISKKLVYRLQKLREKLGTGLHINSGYRCPEHNARVGGVPNSRHVVGDAADISCSVLPNDVANKYEFDLNFGGDSGIGRYSSFAHIDVRGYKARW